jgi:dipeptide/tripeptide permease
MLKTLRSFPATFYVANTMEIFERMAWYGFYALASLYITGSREDGCLGFSDEDRGFITGVIPFILYLLPVVTGALADKFGYKRTFFLAYAILTPSYFLLGQVTSFWLFFLVFLSVAVGAALFKPVVTGTIARVTTSETKAMGFGIFYMIVNVGGFLGPLVATVVRGWGWRYIFVASACWIGLNFIPLLLFYRDPKPATEAPKTSETFGGRMWRVWRDMTQVLGNTRFFLFVAVLLVALMLAGGGRIPWSWFFVFLGAWVVLNVVLDLVLGGYSSRAPVPAGEIEAFWTPMRLGDWRFGLYLLIVAGFWTEFNQMFLTMPLFIRDYVDTVVIQDGVRWFFGVIPGVGSSLVDFWNWALRYITEDGEIKPENLINLDALCIVFFQVAITALFAKWKPFRTIIIGTLLTGASMILGIFSDSDVMASAGWICVASIATFAVGEMMASPKSQEYVARIAPPGKEAMYMGYYFVSVALGNLFGGLLSGQAYGAFANPDTGNGHPEHMWMIFAGIAAGTAIVLALFDRFLRSKDATDAEAGASA